MISPDGSVRCQGVLLLHDFVSFKMSICHDGHETLSIGTLRNPREREKFDRTRRGPEAVQLPQTASLPAAPAPKIGIARSSPTMAALEPPIPARNAECHSRDSIVFPPRPVNKRKMPKDSIPADSGSDEKDVVFGRRASPLCR
jgi:hypothetical protein